jgi:DNA polymerase III epsilon subunit-like protein
MQTRSGGSRTLKRTLLVYARLLGFGVLLLPHPSVASPPQATSAAGRPSYSRIKAVVRQVRPEHARRLSAGQKARVKGLLYKRFPALYEENVRLSKKKFGANRDATFAGQHPAFVRLSESGWYEKADKIDSLRSLSLALKENRRAQRFSTPLSDVEYLSFDIEATSGRAGKWDKKKKRYLFGRDEIFQFGYVVYKGGKVIEKGNIDINSDVNIPKPIRTLTRANMAKVRKSPRFEQVADKILGLMQGRVLVGQSAKGNDWGWLRSNLARLGVDLPRSKGLILDTHTLSYNAFADGAGVETMAEAFGIKPEGRLHNALTDADVTMQILERLLADGNAKTLGDAFALQNRGYQMRGRSNARQREAQRAESRARKKAKEAAEAAEAAQ